MLTFDKVQAAAAAASERLQTVKKKYTDIKPYLVYASPYGQADIHADPAVILREFPQMVVDSPHKTKAIGLLKAIRQAEDQKDSDKSLQRLQAELPAVIAHCRFKGDTNIEIRFGHLVYKRIRELKQESIVHRELTHQSDASIRVVMDTVARLAESETASSNN